jgi:hypothetical protein
VSPTLCARLRAPKEGRVSSAETGLRAVVSANLCQATLKLTAEFRDAAMRAPDRRLSLRARRPWADLAATAQHQKAQARVALALARASGWCGLARWPRR